MHLRHAASLIVGLAVVSTTVSEPRAHTQSTAETEAVSAWLSRSAIRLKSLEAGHGADDLQPLTSILAGVRIVGLGEGTHGTREFFQVRHRLIEFLVTHMGFTVLVMEGGYGASLAVNDYVLYGRGDLNRALAKFGAWTWDTDEVRRLIEWMRAYNSSVPESSKVRFLGYDPDLDPKTGEVVTSYLERVAPDHVEVAETAMRPLLSEPEIDVDLAVTLPNNGRPERRESETAAIRDRLDRLLQYFVANESEFTKRTSGAEFEQALHCVRTIKQYDEIFGRTWFSAADPMNSGLALRDIYTADNVKRFLTHAPQARMVVWAHNGHVATGPIVPSVPSLGSYLRNAYGNEYYAVGAAFDQGSFQARNLDPDDARYGAVQEFTVGPAVRGMAEWYLGRAGLQNFFVDLRSVRQAAAVAAWLRSPVEMRHTLGAGYSSKWPRSVYTRRIVLKDYYDGLVFVSRTSRAQPNPSGVRGPLRRPVSPAKRR